MLVRTVNDHQEETEVLRHEATTLDVSPGDRSAALLDERSEQHHVISNSRFNLHSPKVLHCCFWKKNTATCFVYCLRRRVCTRALIVCCRLICQSEGGEGSVPWRASCRLFLSPTYFTARKSCVGSALLSQLPLAGVESGLGTVLIELYRKFSVGFCVCSQCRAVCGRSLTLHLRWPTKNKIIPLKPFAGITTVLSTRSR